MPAFRGISADCNAIIADLKDQLKDSFRGSLVTGKELVANVGYLIQLDEQPETLAQEYLNSAISQLKLELQSLQKSSKVEVSFGDLGAFFEFESVSGQRCLTSI